MSNETNNKDTIKIKMDAYTTQLYQDFVMQLTERLRSEASSIEAKLQGIITNLKTNSVLPTDAISELSANLMSALAERETSILNQITNDLTAPESPLIMNSDNNRAHVVNKIVELESAFSGFQSELSKPESIIYSLIQDRINSTLASYEERSIEQGSAYVSEVIARINEAGNGLLKDIKNLNAIDNTRFLRLGKIAGARLQRVIQAEQLIHEAIRIISENNAEYHSSVEDKLASMINAIGSLQASSSHLLEITEPIEQSLAKLTNEQTSSTHRLVAEQTGRVVDSLSGTINNVQSQLLGTMATLSQDLLRSKEVMQAHVSSEVNKAIQELDSRLSKIEGALTQEKQSIQGKYAALMAKESRLADQLITNQELLIWILTPWYKKIFKRKNEKPQILVK